ncbi:MAG TPA: ATP-binding protein [Thermoanaerobaculia bacterium]|nr:ATP-binding protein [Thermoanaerobaculia bacterium]
MSARPRAGGGRPVDQSALHDPGEAADRPPGWEVIAADRAAALAQYLERSQLIHCLLLAPDGTVCKCNRALATRLHMPADQIRGANVSQFLTDSDADSLRRRLTAGQSGLREPFYLNFVDTKQLPFTLECYLDAQSDFTLLLGEPPRLYETTTPEKMIGLTNELTILSREAARKNKELLRLMEEADRANRAKSVFLSNVSHELRTPLNSIIGFSEVLGDRVFGELNSKQAEYVENILASGRHLLDVISDILDLAKIDAERVELDLAEVNLEELLADLANILEEMAGRSGITLTVRVSPDFPLLYADARRLRQVLLNLLANACNFTPAGGSVTLSAARAAGERASKEERVWIAVQDTGKGIAREDQGRLFQAFEQLATGSGRLQPGTGLGLALSRRLVELHGGRIWLESEGLGKGSTFTFDLPVRARRSDLDIERAPAETE